MKYYRYYLVFFALLTILLQYCASPTKTIENQIVEGDPDSSDTSSFIPYNGSWKNINSPVADDLIDVYFINSNLGWAISYRSIIKTNDGGNNWEVNKEMNTPYPFSSIQFLDENIGWVSVSDNLILSTRDGGNNWNEIIAPTGTAKVIFFLNDSIGWTGGSSGIFKTSNAGITWKKQLDVEKWEGIRDIFFINDSLGWADCLYYWNDDPGGPTVQWADVYKTIDGGNNWQKVAKLDGVLDVTAIKFFDPMNGVLNCDRVYLTHDGGHTWMDTKSLASHNLYFVNKNYGWIVGAYSVKTGFVIGVTTDGAKNWHYMKDIVKDVSHDLNAVFFCDSYTGLAVGRNGTILKYFPPPQ